MAKNLSLLQHTLIICFRFYRRFISPLFPPSCRFTPSCSQYAIEAIMLHGGIKGGWLAIKRILKCHPLHVGGHDPVPKNKTRTDHNHH